MELCSGDARLKKDCKAVVFFWFSYHWNTVKRKYHQICCDTHPILRSGYAAILFSLGQYNLCMFNTGTNRKAAHSVLLTANEISRDFSLHIGLSA